MSIARQHFHGHKQASVHLTTPRIPVSQPNVCRTAPTTHGNVALIPRRQANARNMRLDGGGQSHKPLNQVRFPSHRNDNRIPARSENRKMETFLAETKPLVVFCLLA